MVQKPDKKEEKEIKKTKLNLLKIILVGYNIIKTIITRLLHWVSIDIIIVIISLFVVQKPKNKKEEKEIKKTKLNLLKIILAGPKFIITTINRLLHFVSMFIIIVIIYLLMVQKPKNKKEEKEIKKTKLKLLKIILVGYIIILILGLYIYSDGQNHGVNKLYNELYSKCYNYDDLMANNNFYDNNEYVIGYYNYEYGKYNCTVMLKSEFENNLYVKDEK